MSEGGYGKGRGKGCYSIFLFCSPVCILLTYRKPCCLCSDVKFPCRLDLLETDRIRKVMSSYPHSTVFLLFASINLYNLFPSHESDVFTTTLSFLYRVLLQQGIAQRYPRIEPRCHFIPGFLSFHISPTFIRFRVESCIPFPSSKTPTILPCRPGSFSEYILTVFPCTCVCLCVGSYFIFEYRVYQNYMNVSEHI